MGDAGIQIPKLGKAACVVNPGADFSVELKDDIPVPEPGNGEVLIKLTTTGICYSDLHYMLEDLPIGSMVNDFHVHSPGHEGIGHVVKIGAGVESTAVPPLKVGDKVGLKPVWKSCGSCELCTSEREMYCTKAQQTGLHVPGTYQQYVLGWTDHVVRIPDGVEDVVAAPIMCAGATIYRGVSITVVIEGGVC